MFRYCIMYSIGQKVYRENILASDWNEAKDITKSKGDFISCILI